MKIFKIKTSNKLYYYNHFVCEKIQIQIDSETTFSTIKKMFGGHMSPDRFQNMVKEMYLKTSLYNPVRQVT
jgi:hypothetical protein